MGLAAMAEARTATGLYLVKTAISATERPLGSQAAAEGLEAHLYANGGRSVHLSRGYVLDVKGHRSRLSDEIKRVRRSSSEAEADLDLVAEYDLDVAA
jgi:hypothetical protein